MKRHILKTDSEVFQASWDEIKTFEIRIDDRDFQVGNELLLAETVASGEEMKKGALLEYTGRFIIQTITYKLKGMYGLSEGWCILGTDYMMCGDDYDPEDHSFGEEDGRRIK